MLHYTVAESYAVQECDATGAENLCDAGLKSIIIRLYYQHTCEM